MTRVRQSKSLRTAIFGLSAIVASLGVADAQTGRSDTPTVADSSLVYSGVYASTSNESLFSPCNVPGIGSGWWLRFADERLGPFLRNRLGPGSPALSHFIRVRGRVSPQGHYGLGFNTREIVVDSVLDVNETPQPCASYEDLPLPWDAVKSSGAAIIGAATTDDRTMVAVLDRKGVISVWNARLGQLLKQFQSDDKGNLPEAFRVPLTFTHDGKRLAAGGVDGVVRVWNPLTGQSLWTFAATDTMNGTVNGVRRVARSEGLNFNQSGTLLANIVSGRVAILSTVSGQRLETFKEGWWNTKLLFTGDSSFIASGDSGLVKVYPRIGAAPIWRIKTQLRSFEWMERSPDGRWLALNGQSDTLHLWSLNDGLPSRSIGIPRWFGFGAIAFSLDGNTLATSGGTQGLYVWDTKTGQPLRSFEKFPNILVNAWFTADGRSIVTLPMYDTVLRIVHLDPRRSLSGPNAAPIQAWWGSYFVAPKPPGTPLGSIYGFVWDSSKKAIVGADVTLYDGDKPGSAPLASTRTNAAGRFLLQGVKVRHAALRASKRGFAAGSAYAHLPALGVGVAFELKPEGNGP
jgi:WD40 repeat protein